MGSRRLGRKRIYALNKLGQSSAMTAGSGAPGIASSTVSREGHLITTEIAIDLSPAGGAISIMGKNDLALGTSGSAAGVLVANKSYLGTITRAVNGIVTAAECICVELPTRSGGSNIDIDFIASSADIGYSGSLTGTTALITAGGNWVLGKNITGDVEDNGAEGEFIYLANGAANAGDTTATFTAGKFILRLYGYAVPDDQ